MKIRLDRTFHTILLLAFMQMVPDVVAPAARIPARWHLAGHRPSALRGGNGSHAPL
ncbi:hypothetical protein [Methylorubrum extorquens]|uniref:hypothetical protein n=1 Tax=Methylorubrum extorquens TaxID=408 RepID=UPI001EE500E7|nr:hypothetical protein [Methylorubrum extorquens]MCG5248428.1 hypothetical protein [Methylorubrum extorquens]